MYGLAWRRDSEREKGMGGEEGREDMLCTIYYSFIYSYLQSCSAEALC